MNAQNAEQQGFIDGQSWIRQNGTNTISKSDFLIEARVNAGYEHGILDPHIVYHYVEGQERAWDREMARQQGE